MDAPQQRARTEDLDGHDLEGRGSGWLICWKLRPASAAAAGPVPTSASKTAASPISKPRLSDLTDQDTK